MAERQKDNKSERMKERMTERQKDNKSRKKETKKDSRFTLGWGEEVWGRVIGSPKATLNGTFGNAPANFKL